MTDHRRADAIGPPLFGALIAALLTACVSAPAKPPEVASKPIVIQAKPPPEKESEPVPEQDSLTSRIRRDVELGSPSSLQRALQSMRQEGIDTLDFGRAMTFVAVRMANALYPDLKLALPPVDPPQLSPYYKILQDVDKGVYRPPGAAKADFLELLLPSFVLLGNPGPDVLKSAEADLLAADSMGKSSALTPYFLGLLRERSQDYGTALSFYERARLIASDCYPADLGRVRALMALDRPEAALGVLVALREKFPDHNGIKKTLALAYYESGDYAKASPLVASVLQSEPSNSRFLLMRAHLLVLAKSYQQATPLLDAYAGVNPKDRLFLLLRARVAWEGENDAEKALGYLKTGLEAFPDDEDLSMLAARIRMRGTEADKVEGRLLLGVVLAEDPKNVEALRFLLVDSLAGNDPAAPAGYLERLIAEDKGFSDYSLAVQAYRKGGELASALDWAGRWYQSAPDSEDAASTYVQLLIATKSVQAAQDLIAKKIQDRGSSKFKSRLWTYKSRLEPSDDAAMSDLRSSLLENPENLEALVAMFDLYFKQKDYRKAQFYLKQALAAGPQDPEVLARDAAYSKATSQGGP
jgi:tetratricopeptide (TPR) repeat protein